MKNKGFSLIELLIVIAIVGILSSIVLSSLNTTEERNEQTENCSMYENLNVSNIPAKCLNYFGINSINQ